MPKKNQYDLSRTIPVEVKRIVRQRCKFGCVVCREGFYTYEHIEPTFVKAEVHDPDKMCLLCSTCQDKVTRSVYSKEKIWHHYKRVSSDERVKPPHSDFDVGGNNFSVTLGKCEFEQPRAIFSIDGEMLLGFSPPEYEGGRPRLSGVFLDDKGRDVLRIEEDEWFGDPKSWDITTEGGKTASRISIWTARGKRSLGIKLVPPRSIEIYHLNMRMGSAIVRNNKEYLEVVRETRDGPLVFGMYGDCTGASSCVDIDTRIQDPYYQGVEIGGGTGTKVLGTGITWGKNAGRQSLFRATLNGEILFDASRDLPTMG